jgi:hypothetical protein
VAAAWTRMGRSGGGASCCGHDVEGDGATRSVRRRGGGGGGPVQQRHGIAWEERWRRRHGFGRVRRTSESSRLRSGGK